MTSHVLDAPLARPAQCRYPLGMLPAVGRSEGHDRELNDPALVAVVFSALVAGCERILAGDRAAAAADRDRGGGPPSREVG